MKHIQKGKDVPKLFRYNKTVWFFQFGEQKAEEISFQTMY